MRKVIISEALEFATILTAWVYSRFRHYSKKYNGDDDYTVVCDFNFQNEQESRYN